MEIFYATSNKNKIESAQKNLAKFDIDIKGISLSNIIEIQTEDIEEISVHKAKQAFKKVKKPLITSDSGWDIPALNNFPGALMAYVNNKFEAKDFLNLMKDKKDRTIILNLCITYIDENGFKTFKHKTEGEFLQKEEGEGTSLDKVVTLREDKKSIAKCLNEEIPTRKATDLWDELGEYILNKTKHN